MIFHILGIPGICKSGFPGSNHWAITGPSLGFLRTWSRPGKTTWFPSGWAPGKTTSSGAAWTTVRLPWRTRRRRWQEGANREGGGRWLKSWILLEKNLDIPMIFPWYSHDISIDDWNIKTMRSQCSQCFFMLFFLRRDVGWRCGTCTWIDLIESRWGD